MNLNLISTISLSLFCLFSNGQTTSKLLKESVIIDAIPNTMEWINSPKAFEINSNNSISITANEKTDFYHYAGGGYNSSTAPILMFKADDEFVLTAAVEVDFNNNYDGGFLMVYDDTSHYAKLLFEQNHKKEMIYCSCVTNEVADDNIHGTIKKNKVFFRIAKADDVIIFYTSVDGQIWDYVRIFPFVVKNNLKIGFASQSPEGKECTATFSEIEYSPNRVTDFWTGN